MFGSLQKCLQVWPDDFFDREGFGVAHQQWNVFILEAYKLSDGTLQFLYFDVAPAAEQVADRPLRAVRPQ